MTRIFIDGSAGTTGLRIVERISERRDLELIRLSEEKRKDPEARKWALNEADIVFLCLPDAAAIESAAMMENPGTVVIDTSTAHRIDPNWVYGFPELKGQREKISASTRIANPGCHASGFISLAAPLVQNGLISADTLLSAVSLTGYSGGGKKMIAQYEADPAEAKLGAPGQYGLTQMHKHLPEMKVVCGLQNAPAFSPIVAPYYAGMQVTIPLFASQIKGSVQDLKDCYRSYYQQGLVHYSEDLIDGGFLYAGALANYDDMTVTVCGNEERILLISTFDNLGKGASGAAIQNMNVVLGLPEGTGLNLRY